ncbi:class I SAM-dependent DNA methyltransferase [Melghirimyces algeriensis]|uniref:Ubiquinone/menaquinone biosynthesis C-methylase UbiE n=1 Tax=Melghirimyces algeriensis TaxID=910412 RepID=A0A521ABE8_9BACL|nr:class I SAM-dependent methyltransferase [Melghirimyces algeriensis]SMO32125.1 Ubiquinone/menaquinone biosynthesis C-methylase UbiE [Melghirimyces algeriensis]
MYSFYGKLSTEIYDLDKPIGHSFGDVEFYRERLKTCQGSILEPAVGTGRILIPLLQEGNEVHGMDRSPEMLSLCHAHCERRGLSPQLYEEDMVSFSLPQKYEAIIVPTGSFLLIKDRNDSIEALRCFYKHLVPGGRLILDIFLQTDLQLGHVSTRTWTNAEGDLITLDEKRVKVDYIQQYTVSHMKYEKWRDKKLVQTELEYFPLRWYGVEEFRSILEQIGFSDIVISADYQYGEYPTKGDQTITFEAHRPKA